jgi:predicted nucleic acid-binding protein
MTGFLDTVGLLALWDESDQWHRLAMDCFNQFSVLRANVTTTTFIMLECGNASARRP